MKMARILRDYDEGMLTRWEAISAVLQAVSPEDVPGSLHELPADLLDELKQWVIDVDPDKVAAFGGNLSRAEAQRMVEHARTVIPALKSHFGAGHSSGTPSQAATSVSSPRLAEVDEFRLEGRRITWAGLCPWTTDLCFGTADGALVFEVKGEVKSLEPGEMGPVNGVAFSGLLFGVSSGNRVTVFKHDPSWGEARQKAPVFKEAPALGLAGSPRGTFVAPLGEEGLLLIDNQPSSAPLMSICQVAGERANLSRVSYLGERDGRELFAFACRQNGLLCLDRSLDGACGEMFDYPLRGLDLVDVCSLQSSKFPLGVAGLFSDGTVLLSKNLAETRPDRLTLFEAPEEAVFLLCLAGHLFIQTRSNLLSVPGLISRYANDEPMTEPLLIRTMPCRSTFLGHMGNDRILLLSEGEGCSVSVEALVRGAEAQVSNEHAVAHLDEGFRGTTIRRVPTYLGGLKDGPRHRVLRAVA
jgi:hypothetical protein